MPWSIRLPIPARRRVLAVAAGLASATAGCEGRIIGPVSPPTAIALDGFVERGGRARLLVVDDSGRRVSVRSPRWRVRRDTAGLDSAAAVAALARIIATVEGDTLVFRDTGVAVLDAEVLIDDPATVDPRTIRLRRTVRVPRPPRLVFWSVRRTGNTPNADIYAVDLDGGDLRRLTTDPAVERDPTVADSVVVYTRLPSVGTPAFWRMRLDGTGVAFVTTDTIRRAQPRFAPDGRRLAWVREAGGGRIWVSGPDGTTGAMRFPPAERGVATDLEASPAWSPDGRRLAYVTSRDPAGLSIWAGDLEGAPGSATRLVGGAGTGDNIQPAWSPDGSWLAFVSDRDGIPELYRYDVASRATTRLTRGCNCFQPSFLPDGRLLFVQFAPPRQGAPREESVFLRWVDPAHPGRAFDVPTGGAGEGPMAVR